jgi:outer membrane receptor protein involved in Fe transport
MERGKLALDGQVANGQRRRGLFATTSILLGAAAIAQADCAVAATSDSNPSTVGEVIVTASRRDSTVSKLPFNISAFSGQQLQRANITSLTALTQEVPNFVILDQGARTAEASVPIIRGLNASQSISTIPTARYFQSPVGFYLDNSIMVGSLPIFDIDRIEVLRGPQGTLYGAGALSGAIRVVTTQPKLGAYSGFLSGSVGAVSHSAKLDNDVSGAINIPIGENAAVRIVAKHQYDAGFIDQFDIIRRQGANYLGGLPTLADPAHPASSSAVYFNKKDVNFTDTSSARVEFLWKPTDKLSLTAAYNYSYVRGDGGPIDNNVYPGGPSYLDPRITLHATGDYQRSLSTLEPFDRTSHLASLDLSYDMGFATLASTFSYGETRGRSAYAGSLAIEGVSYDNYYFGSPRDPRAVISYYNPDSENTYAEEVRLVSKTGSALDYVVGAYLEQQARSIATWTYDPGIDGFGAAPGGPNLSVFPDNSVYKQTSIQRFNDYSIYGDLTWHVTPSWQITAGTRIFYQTFSDQFTSVASLFAFSLGADNSTRVSGPIFKLNSSYRLGDSNQVYATWSQGYRRGGANGFILAGNGREPQSLLVYQPDKTNNYEAGAKGTIHGVYYSADVFYVDWSKPQIDTLTPVNLWAVVVNGTKAVSKGVELELSGPSPFGPDGLSFNVGWAYAKARLSQDFSLPAGDGAGNIVPGMITGKAGERLPGAPDFSGALNVNFRQDLGDASWVTYSLGVDYRSSIINNLPTESGPGRVIPAYAMLHGNIEFYKGDWQVQVFGTNLTDQRILLGSAPRAAYSAPAVGALGEAYTIARPREIGIRVTRHW